MVNVVYLLDRYWWSRVEMATVEYNPELRGKCKELAE
jgi:hypothetical protein